MFVWCVGILYIIPWHHGVPASQSGGVQLEDGGDVHAVGNRHQSVHDLLLWSSQTASQSFVICIQLERENRKSVRGREALATN